MAKAGDKKRLETNTKKLQLLRAVIAAAVILHVVIRLVLRRSSAGNWTMMGFLLTMLIELVCYRALAQIAVPTYGPGGELVSGGGDLALGGVTAYYWDAVYLAVFVQLSTTYSSKFWLVFLVVPGYAFWQLWVNALQPWIFAPSPEEAPETEAQRTKRERAEKRSQRRGQRYA